MRYLILILSLATLGLSAQEVKPTGTSIDEILNPSPSESEILNDTIVYPGQSEDPEMFKTTVDGHVMTAMITEEGDTLIMATLDDMSITTPRTFASAADYRKYMKFKRYAAIVYPYAKDAIRIFKENEHITATMNRRQRKKYVKKLQDELKAEFEEPLMKLTKLQGKIMVKMIEKELDKSMYDLIKGVRGRFAAMYWHNASKLYSYDLKEGYNYGDYKILDAVLEDFDVSYRIEQDRLEELNAKK